MSSLDIFVQVIGRCEAPETNKLAESFTQTRLCRCCATSSPLLRQCLLQGLRSWTSMELFQPRRDALCKCDQVPSWNHQGPFHCLCRKLGYLAEQNGFCWQFHPSLFLRFISFPRGVVCLNGDGNLEFCWIVQVPFPNLELLGLALSLNHCTWMKVYLNCAFYNNLHQSRLTSGTFP